MSERQQAFVELGEPQKRGQASEAIIRSKLLVRDISVFLPAYDNEPYDFVAEMQNDFYRIQCKTAYGGPDTVQFETVSTRARSDGYRRQGYRGTATCSPSTTHLLTTFT